MSKHKRTHTERRRQKLEKQKLRQIEHDRRLAALGVTMGGKMGSPAGLMVDKGGWARPVDNFTSKGDVEKGD